MLMSRSQSSAILACALAMVLALAGCSASQNDTSQASAQPDAEKSRGLLSSLMESSTPVTVPAGTPIQVTLDQSLASNRNRSGDDFEASLARPVVVNGKTVIPKGARVRGIVVDAKESGRLQGVAHLQIELRAVEVGSKSYDLETSSVTRTGSNHNKRNLGYIGGGTAGGALIGAIAGGGKGAAIGAAVGAGAGTAGAAATGKKDVLIPAETPLSFKLTQPVTIQVKG